MVAAHPFDLDGAKIAGCTTIYVPRPKEYGIKAKHKEPAGKEKIDYEVQDFIALAELLGA